MKFKFALSMLLLFSIPSLFAQNDCRDAITVCGNMGYEGLSAEGVGMQELNNNSNDCTGVETNSLWLRLPINTSGTLSFVLTPNDPSIDIDFDFYIFGPHATCGNIGHAIRCSTTNPAAVNAFTNQTGLSENETDTSEGPGPNGNSFVSALNVQAGDVYFLVIDRPIGGSDFSLQWTGTATFFDAPVFNNPQATPFAITMCDSDGVDDQKSVFDLTANNAAILNGQPNVILSYHESINDAVTNINPITTPDSYTNTSNPQTIYMRMTNGNTDCFTTEELKIEITNSVITGKPKDFEACDSKETGFQTFNLAENDDLIINGAIDTALSYYASLTDAQNKTNPLPSLYQNTSPTQTIWARLESTAVCLGHSITSFTITVTPLPKIVYTLDVKDFTNNTNSIRIVMPDPENYLFSIDGKNFSDVPLFENLLPGPYTIYIKAKTGCKTISEDLIILNYPKFFSPNGDGKNETWRIPYLNLQPQAVVTIYDRYGKIITGFKGGSPGWDGTLNNKKLPSTDYWFVLQLDSGRIIKGHFAMVR